MKNTGRLKVITPTDREIAMTRVLDAPRSLVFDAWTKPELLKRWLGARVGWSMVVCEIDLKVGGTYRFVWAWPRRNRHRDARRLSRDRTVRAARRHRVVRRTLYPGEALVTNVLVEQGGKTTLTTTELYESREARDADQVLHVLEVYPPWGQPMYDPSLNLLALAYRSVYGVVGSYIAARFAPRAPMHHALALGVVGLVLSVAGAIAMWDFGPNWYPVALVLTTLPCAWFGGVLHRNKAGRTRPLIWSMQ